MMRSIIVSLFICFGISNVLLAQKPPVKDTMSDDVFMRVMEQSISMYLSDFAKDGNTDSIRQALGYESNTTPEFTDDIYCQRLAAMNEKSSFGFDCNATTLSSIRTWASSRRNFAKIILGRSKLYFELYEEKLTEYGIPQELKYLSVIESALQPKIKSHAGAVGLWQFMYATGKHYGLANDSYIDERMDPVKATDAACRLLKKLYNIYGDWNLALAAYNAGPGNVNKAIKRSGGKRTYWEIRPFLPRETQNYVPNFIAAAYLFTYQTEHNIVPAAAKVHYVQLDTMCLNRSMHMQTIDAMIHWSVEEIQAMNPVYKTTYIPNTYPQQCITGPLEKIGLLVSLEDDLYALERKNFGNGGNTAPTNVTPPNNASDQLVVSDPKPEVIPKMKTVTTIKYTYHKAQPGETLGKIAADYNVSVQNLMEWNNLTTSEISANKVLKIQTLVTTEIENPEYVEPQPQDTVQTQVVPEPKPTPTPTPAIKKYYTVRSGDSYGKIAQKHGTTVTRLKQLNPGVNPARIQVGQKIRVK